MVLATSSRRRHVFTRLPEDPVQAVAERYLRTAPFMGGRSTGAVDAIFSTSARSSAIWTPYC